jgi:PKD repeat protein
MRVRTQLMGLAVMALLVGCGGGEEPKKTPPPTPAPAGPATPPSTAKAGVEPLAIFLDANTIEGKAPLTVSFDLDIDGGTPPYKYKWDFGDGQKGTDANPALAHTYDKPGTYMVEVTIDDAGGDSDFDILEIEVK